MNSIFLASLLILIFQSTYAAFNLKARDKCTITADKCTVSASHVKEPLECKIQRNKSIAMSRQFYKLTRFGEKQIIKFPLPFIPFLNQTMETVKFVAAMDPIDSRWLARFGTIRAAVDVLGNQLLSMFGKSTFTTIEDYINIFNMHKVQVKHLELKAPHIFSNPSLYQTFTDIVSNDRYLSDDIFVQRRLAGPCPFLIKLVTFCGSVGMKWVRLKELLNPTFNFDDSVRVALNDDLMTMERAIEEERLYVLYHEENNNITSKPDFFDANKTMIQETSPIALFVRTKDGELKPVAIQIDYKPTSKVFTPNSNILEWILAKTMVNSADFNLCQALWHLSHLHFSSGVYCHIYKSHFSSLHPIYQIMQHHCEGTTPHISLTYTVLTDPNFGGHKFFAMTHTGFIDLTVAGVKQYNYGTLAFDELLKRRGLYNKRIKYHPFRDDGVEIWGTFKSFADQFINEYYRNDANVQEDLELQSYARQISIDGGAGDMYGGKGNIVGFPSEFKTKSEVKLFITRFLWNIAVHASVNYPLEPWVSFVPATPTKLYSHEPVKGESERDFLAKSSSGMGTTIGMTNSAGLLGSFRANRIFDYYGMIEDNKLSKLVKKYHKYLFSCVQPRLAKRNAERKAKDQVGFQYFEPMWLTNSVHI